MRRTFSLRGYGRHKKDPFGEQVTDWMPSMQKKLAVFKTREAPLTLKNLSQGNGKGTLASTSPFYVNAPGQAARLSSIHFHSFLYSHGATAPFRPLVLRSGLAALSKCSKQKMIQKVLEGDKNNNENLSPHPSYSSWRQLEKDQIRHTPSVPFEVKSRAGVDLMLLPATLKPEPVPLFETEESQQQHRHQLEEEAAVRQRSKDNRNSSSNGNSSSRSSSSIYTHHQTESIFQPLWKTSIRLTIRVNKEDHERVIQMNERMLKNSEVGRSGRQLWQQDYRTKDNSSLSTPGMNTALAVPSRMEIVLHEGDLCFLPRFWVYQVELLGDGGGGVGVPISSLGSSSGRFHQSHSLHGETKRKEESWPLQDWEAEDPNVQIIRTSRSLYDDVRPTSEEVPPIVLRHYFEPFPILSEDAAALARCENFKETRTFYQTNLPALGVAQPPRPVTSRSSAPQPLPDMNRYL